MLGGLRGWRERRRVMREMSRIDEENEMILAGDPTNPVHCAASAIAAGDRATAERYWEEALVRCPRYARRAHEALGILIGLRRFDEAASVMKEAARQMPRDPFFAEGYALAAEQAEALEEAAKRWRQAARLFPDRWQPQVHRATCLRRLGQTEAAEAQMQDVIRRFPREPAVRIEWAWCAEGRMDWAAALQRWQEVCDICGHEAGETGVARALEALGRTRDAEARLLAVLPRLPQHPEIAVMLARLAVGHGDMEAARDRWSEVRRRFPDLVAGYDESARLLQEQGRMEDAAAVLREAAERFPGQGWPAERLAALGPARQG